MNTRCSSLLVCLLLASPSLAQGSDGAEHIYYAFDGLAGDRVLNLAAASVAATEAARPNVSVWHTTGRFGAGALRTRAYRGTPIEIDTGFRGRIQGSATFDWALTGKRS